MINSTQSVNGGAMLAIDRNSLANHDRRHFVGGSDARIIMGRDEKALARLWKEKRGEGSPVDLSRELIVQLGLVTEDLNRRWYEGSSGNRIGHVQRRLTHRTIPWMAATLDGLVKETGAVFEAKFMLPGPSPRRPPARNTWPSSSTTCWSRTPRLSPVDHHRRGQMGRTRNRGRPDLPDRTDSCRESLLAGRQIW
jgi:hypothetical protein